MMQKHKELLLLCLCLWMFLLQTYRSVFVYSCTIQPQKNINPYGDNLYGRSLHFSYLWRGEEEEEEEEEEEGCGVMCSPDSRPPRAQNCTQNNPQSNTGTQDWIDLHTKQRVTESSCERDLWLPAPPLRPPQRDGTGKSGKTDFAMTEGVCWSIRKSTLLMAGKR